MKPASIWGPILAAGLSLVASVAEAQVYSYRNGLGNRILEGGPLGPAPLDPYSVSSYFGWLPSPIVARQTVGHEIIPTGPNGYVYRPIYADQLEEPSADVLTGSAYRGGSADRGGPAYRGRGPAARGKSDSFVARHALSPSDASVPLFPQDAIPDAAREPQGGPVDDELAAALAGLRAGDYELARERSQSILNRDPKRGDAALVAAQALFALADYPAAVAKLARATELLPESEWDRYVADYRRYFPSALQYVVRLRLLEHYVDERPGDRAGLVLLAYHYGALGFFDEALRLLDANPNQENRVKGDSLARRLRAHDARFARPQRDDEPAPAPQDVEAEADEGPREF